MVNSKCNIFDYNDYDDTISRDIALTAFMLYPNSMKKRHSYIFRATVHHYGCLSADSKDAPNANLSQSFLQLLAELGSWKWLAAHEENAQTQPLDTIFASRLIRGHIAAHMLIVMISKNISIFEAAKYYLKVMQSRDARITDYIKIIKTYKKRMGETDLSGNVWNEFKNISPLFVPTALASASLIYPYIRFDTFMTRKLNIKDVTRDGFPGFCEMAMRYTELAVDRKILNKKEVFDCIIPPMP